MAITDRPTGGLSVSRFDLGNQAQQGEKKKTRSACEDIRKTKKKKRTRMGTISKEEMKKENRPFDSPLGFVGCTKRKKEDKESSRKEVMFMLVMVRGTVDRPQKEGINSD